MRTTLKIILPLIVSVAVVSLFYAGYQVRTEKRNLRNDLARRSSLLAESLEESIEPLLDRPSGKNLQRLVDRFGERERLKGIAVYDNSGAALAITAGLAGQFHESPEAATRAARFSSEVSDFIEVQGVPMHISALPLHRDGHTVGTLAVFYDASYIDKRNSYALRDALLNALIQTLLIALMALVLVRWTLMGPLARTAKWLRTLRAGAPHDPGVLPQGEIFDQIHKEVTHLAQDLNTARATAEAEARLRESQSSLWTAERLRVSLQNKLHDKTLFVVSNREPYMHMFNEKDKSIDTIVPASGVVTALEPVLRACNGTWIANGSGNADREVVDAKDQLRVAQDYHFALLPRMVKEGRPDARVAIFWHIPWPNAEVFGICPWQRELVDGLLGADLIGFHIQSHCNNFLETVDRALEALTEWDRFAVNRQGHITRVRPYPISVAFPENSHSFSESRNAGEERAALCAEMRVEASLLGVGVDRVDYTKGILERFRALERFFELNPAYQQRLTFAQIGAPSRTDIERYKNFLDEVCAEANRINARFQTPRWKPIVFRKKHHSHEEIARFYRASSFCMVTSLHDGMNLVAKEFVAAREDERGALILSTFAGAAHELSDALLVNPYDISQLAESIHRALEMPEEEQARRMQRMRHTVREHNVYRWAANLLSDLTEIRIESTERIEAPQAT